MGLTSIQHILILDLDGVLVHEQTKTQKPDSRLFHIHERLSESIALINAHAVVVTHRSREEANWILRFLGIYDHLAKECFSAEDILRSALYHGKIKRLVTLGLRKSFILPLLCKRYNIRRSQVAFIDDRAENVLDMYEAGAGLALIAPWRILSDQTCISFDFKNLVETVNQWAETSCHSIERKQPMVLPSTTKRLTAEPSEATRPPRKSSVSFFKVLRSVANMSRKAITATGPIPPVKGLNERDKSQTDPTRRTSTFQ